MESVGSVGPSIRWDQSLSSADKAEGIKLQDGRDGGGAEGRDHSIF